MQMSMVVIVPFRKPFVQTSVYLKSLIRQQCHNCRQAERLMIPGLCICIYIYILHTLWRKWQVDGPTPKRWCSRGHDKRYFGVAPYTFQEVYVIPNTTYIIYHYICVYIIFILIHAYNICIYHNAYYHWLSLYHMLPHTTLTLSWHLRTKKNKAHYFFPTSTRDRYLMLEIYCMNRVWIRIGLNSLNQSDFWSPWFRGLVPRWSVPTSNGRIFFWLPTRTSTDHDSPSLASRKDESIGVQKRTMSLQHCLWGSDLPFFEVNEMNQSSHIWHQMTLSPGYFSHPDVSNWGMSMSWHRSVKEYNVQLSLVANWSGISWNYAANAYINLYT